MSKYTYSYLYVTKKLVYNYFINKYIQFNNYVANIGVYFRM